MPYFAAAGAPAGAGFAHHRRPSHPACSLPTPSMTMRSPASTPPFSITLPGRRPPTSTSAFSTRVVGLDPPDEGLAADLLHRDLRHHQRLPGAARHRDFDQHARPQHALGVGEIAAHGDRARAGIQPRRHRGDRAIEAAPGVRAGGPAQCLPRREPASSVSGTGKSTNTRDTSSSVAIDGARRDQRAGADLADAEHAGERRADHAVGEVGADLRDLRAGGIAGRPLRIERRARDQLLRCQLRLALVQLLGFLEGRFGGGQRGLLLLAAEGHQRRAAGDVLPAFEMHLLHGLADLGGDRDRLARMHGAERAQRVRPRLLAYHLHHHRDRSTVAACPARAGLGGRIVLAARGERQREGDGQDQGAAVAWRHGAARAGGPRF